MGQRIKVVVKDANNIKWPALCACCGEESELIFPIDNIPLPYCHQCKRHYYRFEAGEFLPFWMMFLGSLVWIGGKIFPKIKLSQLRYDRKSSCIYHSSGVMLHRPEEPDTFTFFEGKFLDEFSRLNSNRT